MSERFEGESWGDRMRSPETPQQALREQARVELNRIRWETTDALSSEIILKGLEKIAIKDRVDEMQRYADDPTVRQQMKRLGSVVVVEARSRFNTGNRIPGLSIQAGDPYIDLHIPPLSGTDKSPEAISRSMQLLAAYIGYHQIDSKYIIGVTYEKLARVSRRWGFQVAEIPLPEDIKRGVERVFQNFRTSEVDQDMGKLLLCYQTTEDFMHRFARPK